MEANKMKMTKPFNQILVSLCCVMASGSALADDNFNYPQNPIERPITLPDSMVSLSAGAGFVEELDGSDEWFIVPGVQYGVTDNFTIGLDGLTYRFYNDDSLQLAVNGGIRGGFESEGLGDNVASGIGVFGKQVINSNFAVTFGVDFIHWDVENTDDRAEVNYDLGFMYNLSPEWTFSAGYTYRDLEDFSQSSANTYRIGLTYSYLKNVDVGLFAIDSDYEAAPYGYYVRNEVEQGAGIYVNWRF